MISSRFLVGIMLVQASLACLAMDTNQASQSSSSTSATSTTNPAQKAVALQLQLDALLAKVNQPYIAESKAGECAVCYEDQSGKDLRTCKNCNARLCIGCIRQEYNQHKHTPSHIRCRCGEPRAIETILNPSELQALIESFRKEIIQVQPNGRFCPTTDCQHYFTDDVDKATPHYTTCPQCHKNYCSHCLIYHSEKMSCEQAAKAAKKDDQNEEWIKNNTQPCPRCNKRIEKAGGCVNMQCPAPCNTNFTWIPPVGAQPDAEGVWGYNIHDRDRAAEAQRNQQELARLEHNLLRAERKNDRVAIKLTQQAIERLENFIEQEETAYRRHRGREELSDNRKLRHRQEARAERRALAEANFEAVEAERIRVEQEEQRLQEDELRQVAEYIAHNEPVNRNEQRQRPEPVDDDNQEDDAVRQVQEFIDQEGARQNQAPAGLLQAARELERRNAQAIAENENLLGQVQEIIVNAETDFANIRISARLANGLLADAEALCRLAERNLGNGAGINQVQLQEAEASHAQAREHMQLIVHETRLMANFRGIIHNRLQQIRDDIQTIMRNMIRIEEEQVRNQVQRAEALRNNYQRLLDMFNGPVAQEIAHVTQAAVPVVNTIHVIAQQIENARGIIAAQDNQRRRDAEAAQLRAEQERQAREEALRIREAEAAQERLEEENAVSEVQAFIDRERADAQLRAEQEAQRQRDINAAQMREQLEARRRRDEEAARLQAQQDAQRQHDVEAARRRAQQEEQKQRDTLAAQMREQLQALRRQNEEIQAAIDRERAQLRAEQEAQRQRDINAAQMREQLAARRRRDEEAARLQTQQDAQRQRDIEAARLRAQQEEQRQREARAAQIRLEQEAQRRRDAEAARLRTQQAEQEDALRQVQAFINRERAEAQLRAAHQAPRAVPIARPAMRQQAAAPRPQARPVAPVRNPQAGRQAYRPMNQQRNAQAQRKPMGRPAPKNRVPQRSARPAVVRRGQPVNVQRRQVPVRVIRVVKKGARR